LDTAGGVSPGIVFSTTPSDLERKALIEELFVEDLIAVVWHDE